MSKLEPVIGLEVHVELKTNSKLFCPCSTAFGKKPNANVCPICLGFPGALPVVNIQAVALAVKAGLVLNCRINSYNTFDRKNYFYPDLPAGYQISQFFFPVAHDGFLEFDMGDRVKRVGICRSHLEEDAGKLMHEGDSLHQSSFTLCDFNRAGVPLIEIVSDPDLRSGEEARLYLENLKLMLKYADISDCRMEEGSLRCDANISLRWEGEERYGDKVELKNMNSFKAVQQAIEYEVGRQRKILEKNGQVARETRQWDEDKGVTLSMRSKESPDYRCFPEFNLPPFVLEKDFVEKIKQDLPEMPRVRKRRFQENYRLPEYDAEVLTSSRELADYFEQCASRCSNWKAVSNWMMTSLLGCLNSKNLDIAQSPVPPENMAELINLMEDGTLSSKLAKQVWEKMCLTGEDPRKVVQESGLMQIADAEHLAPLIKDIVARNPQAVADFQAGKDRAFGFLVGQVMKETRGKANPALVNQLLKEILQA